MGVLSLTGVVSHLHVKQLLYFLFTFDSDNDNKNVSQYLWLSQVIRDSTAPAKGICDEETKQSFRSVIEFFSPLPQLDTIHKNPTVAIVKERYASFAGVNNRPRISCFYGGIATWARRFTAVVLQWEETGNEASFLVQDLAQTAITWGSGLQ